MPKNVEESIGHAATKIAQDINANAIISIERIEDKGFDDVPYHMNVKVTIFKQVRKGVFKKVEYDTKIRKLESGSVTPVKEILMEGINSLSSLETLVSVTLSIKMVQNSLSSCWARTVGFYEPADSKTVLQLWEKILCTF